jgi:hypothetical protein
MKKTSARLPQTRHREGAGYRGVVHGAAPLSEKMRDDGAVKFDIHKGHWLAV